MTLQSIWILRNVGPPEDENLPERFRHEPPVGESAQIHGRWGNFHLPLVLLYWIWKNLTRTLKKLFEKPGDYEVLR